MVQQRNEVPGGVYYFVSLEARGKAPVFKDAFFKTKVERRWTANMHLYPQAKATEFVVNDNALHAIIVVTNDVLAQEELLHTLIKSFQTAVQDDWKGGGELWSPKPKVRGVTNQDELRSLRDFIVQKMLGGKELSRLEELDEDEDNGEEHYDN
jgi:hypothetical protein